ncbi:Galactosyl transferase GMA12/MNN10 family protein [Salvia divinorum]|uniref:Galactosyl transferase GMA12/MNN10 family protein n=1 Tax=Salvia divinorum TaxID=28513 RepID=A0ABD1IJ72_SALDI
MVSVELHNLTMAKNSNSRRKATTFLSDGFIFAAAALLVFPLVWTDWSFFPTNPIPSLTFSTISAAAERCPNTATVPDPFYDPPEKSFYDDPELSYTIDSPPVKNWDEKRSAWLRQHTFDLHDPSTVQPLPFDYPA